jgi:hypothetical protein
VSKDAGPRPPHVAAPEYWRQLRGNSARHGHFTVSLFDGPLAAVPQRAVPSVVRQFVAPLHALAESTHAYDLSTAPGVDGTLAGACERARGRWMVRPGAIERLVPALAPDDSGVPPGSVVFEFKRASRDLVDVLVNTYDPMVMSNIGAVSRSAVRCARRSARFGRTACVVHGGLGWLSVFAAGGRLAGLLTAVGEQGRTSARFRTLHGAGAAIPSTSGRRTSSFIRSQSPCATR